MVYFPRHHHVARQVTSDPFAAPTAAGISANSLVTAGTATGTALAFDTSAVSDGTTAGPADVLPSFTLPGSSSSPTSSAAPSTSDSASSDSSSEIPIGTVVGVCVGALIGAILLILFGFWLYKRADAKHRKRSPSRSAPRRRSDQWVRMGDDEDKWDGMHKTRELNTGASLPAADSTAEPMEKLTMFKKSSPSIRTAYTTEPSNYHTSDETPLPTTFNLDHPFAQYHPNLAKELASAHDDPPVKPFTSRTEVVTSWDGDASLSGSFLSLRSNRLSGTMSPTADMAIPTPPLTTSELSQHRWESAEVINFEGHAAEIIDPSMDANDSDSTNPFLHSSEVRRKSASGHNPFFGASAEPDRRRPSVSKGKSRDVTAVTTPPTEDSNPFSDEAATTSRTHTAVNSISSEASNDRAIQSLLAALDVKPDDMRVASMQPSVLSAVSYYTEEDVTEAFPLPPSHGDMPGLPRPSEESS